MLIRTQLTKVQNRKLIRLVNAAERAQVNAHNSPDPKNQAGKAVDKIVEYAKELGYDTQFPGIFPVFVKDNQQFHLE